MGIFKKSSFRIFAPRPAPRWRTMQSRLDEHLWTIAAARLVFGAEMNIQAPPNLSPGALQQLVAAGINDWGGVSPVTPDHVNPERPWPQLEALRRETAKAGKVLVERLAIYPAYARAPDTWLDRGAANGRDARGRRRRLCSHRSLESLERSAKRRENLVLPPMPRQLDGDHRRRDRGPIADRRRHRHAYSEAAATPFTPFAKRPTLCARKHAATTSATSSPATSTTPISVISAANSAPSQRASSAKICAGVPTI